MTADETHQLVKLSDTDRTVALGQEDVRGYSVKSRDGEDIGSIEDLLIDPVNDKVRFLIVASGGFLGIGKDHAFIPVDAVTGISVDEVTVDRTREHIAGAPEYAPELSSTRAYQEAVFGHYNYAPYWSAGYLYPGYPFSH
ncbi:MULTISPECIES: PRC-barrel domain-containing protein [unclassified Arthrobacter]|uniref:PRC-barrel domain-containing protein n=1 Tax=unclassified Arthrobacter TaxID=235627 RepID=UPI003395E06A